MTAKLRVVSVRCVEWLRRRRVLIPLILGLATTSPRAGAQAAINYQRARRDLAEYVRRADALGVSGTVLVAEEDSVLVHAAMGWQDPDRRTRNDTASLFYLASLSKQFVSAAVLRLEDDGRLRTTDSIAKYLPGVPADKRAITIDLLLHHLSGLTTVYGYDEVRRDWRAETRDQAVRGILSDPLGSVPGTSFSYQNSNYTLLTAIVERVTGATIEAFLDSTLFRSAGLKDTYLGATASRMQRKRVVWGLGDAVESFNILDRPSSFLRLGHGAFTTARDLHRWIRAIATGRVLSVRARRKLFAIGAQLEPRYGYAAGWFVRTDSLGAPRIVFHAGDNGGYHAEARLSPASGRILVALTNSSYRGGSLTETLLNHLTTVAFSTAANRSGALRDEDFALPVIASTSRHAGVAATAGASAVSGEYRTSFGDALTISARGVSTEVVPSGQRAVDWLFASDSTGWRARHQDAQASMMLVASLNARHVAAVLNSHSVSARLQRELTDEWARLRGHGGQLKSYQLLGAVNEGAGNSRTIVRLTFARDSLLYGVGFSADSFAYTVPGTRHVLGTPVFAPLNDSTWVTYDWTNEASRRLTFRWSRGGKVPAGVMLETSNGLIWFARRAEQ